MGAPVASVSVHPAEYLGYLYRRQETIGRLVGALEGYLINPDSPKHMGGLLAAVRDYLLDDITAAIKRLEAPPAAPAPEFKVEDLVEAQRILAAGEGALQAIEMLASNLDENGNEEMGRLMRESQLPQLEMARDMAAKRLARVQASLELQASIDHDPSNPWPGTHVISTLCAHCAKPYPGVEPSIPKLRETLKRAGWGRDTEGDHICPACVRKQGEV
jgi:hypothetical protein